MGARTGGLSDGDCAGDEKFQEALDPGMPMGSGASYNAGARELGAMLVSEGPPHARQLKRPHGPKRPQVSNPGIHHRVEMALPCLCLCPRPARGGGGGAVCSLKTYIFWDDILESLPSLCHHI